MNEKPVLIVAGPTAVGKTDAAIHLSKEVGAEIVSADSMQIYRGMDIGTAKPDPEQRGQVYHHMIDVADPDQPYSVGDYFRDACSTLNAIIAAGGTPMVVGGTGLYIRALMRGLFHGPPADLALRERLLRRESEAEPGSLYRDLMEADPEAALKIHPNDLRRTIRALEVFYLRDRRISDFHREHSFKDVRYRFNLVFLWRHRTELYPRIDRRVDQMIEAGLEAEVRSLMDRGYNPGLPSLQGLGYKQLIEHFLGGTSREEAIQLLKRDTRRYAKRQFTWFRREPDARWIDITGIASAGEIAAQVKKFVEI